MIRLVNVHRHPLKKRIFYFHTIEDCSVFLKVFKENSCNIKWDNIREIPDTTKIKNSERLLMDKSPKERAERALDWGFMLMNDPYSNFTA